MVTRRTRCCQASLLPVNRCLAPTSKPAERGCSVPPCQRQGPAGKRMTRPKPGDRYTQASGTGMMLTRALTARSRLAGPCSRLLLLSQRTGHPCTRRDCALRPPRTRPGLAPRQQGSPLDGATGTPGRLSCQAQGQSRRACRSLGSPITESNSQLPLDRSDQPGTSMEWEFRVCEPSVGCRETFG
jgi:hypothetical protein